MDGWIQRLLADALTKIKETILMRMLLCSDASRATNEECYGQRGYITMLTDNKQEEKRRESLQSNIMESSPN